MLPIVLLDILQSAVAYSGGLSNMVKGDVAGSPAEGIASHFLWVILPIVAVPWDCVFVTYPYKPKK
jgi:hypothetical protein